MKEGLAGTSSMSSQDIDTLGCVMGGRPGVIFVGLMYMAIDKNAELHDKEKRVWLERGVADVRVDSMAEGIDQALQNEFLFIAINADTIDYLAELPILRDVTSSPILIATSDYSMDEQVLALQQGADSFGGLSETEQNMRMVSSILMRINERESRRRKVGRPFVILSRAKDLAVFSRITYRTESSRASVPFRLSSTVFLMPFLVPLAQETPSSSPRARSSVVFSITYSTFCS
jgi:hypothetical protein